MEENRCSIPMGMQFSVIYRSFRRQMDVLLAEHGLTGPQIGILGRLSYLESRSDEVNQRDVENAAHMSHAAVTDILKRLEAKGFIRITPSTLDKRSKCLRTTEKAKALHERIESLDRQVFDFLCHGMSISQRESFESAMSIMMKNATATKGSSEEE